MVDFWANWVRQYPIVSLEDGMAEDDWDGWKLLTDTLGKKIQLVGDDIYVTNTSIFAKGIDRGIANSILDQAEPDRDGHRDVRSREDGVGRWIHVGDFAPVGRDGGRVYRRLRGRDRRRPDQDGIR